MSASSLDHSLVQQQLQVMQKQMANAKRNIATAFAHTFTGTTLVFFVVTPKSDAIDDTAAVSSLSPEKRKGCPS